MSSFSDEELLKRAGLVVVITMVPAAYLYWIGAVPLGFVLAFILGTAIGVSIVFVIPLWLGIVKFKSKKKNV